MIRRCWLPAALLAILPSISQAAVMFFADGVPGASKTPGYAGWFQADNYSVSVDRANAAQPNVIEVRLENSPAIATFSQAGAAYATFKKIAFDVISFETSILLHSRLTCEEATLRKISSSVDQDDRGATSLMFVCAKLTWEGFEYDKNVVVKATKGSWNFKTNTP